MKIIVIGGTGHIGTYLIPRLVNVGHEVCCVSRQKSTPYRKNSAWEQVKQVNIDRTEAEAAETFGQQIKDLKGEIVIDLISFTVKSTTLLVEALQGEVQQFIHCGTMWVHGETKGKITTEDQKRLPFGDYGINKAKIEAYLLALHKQHDFPATILHPGHITGPGWLPINPAGHLDPEIFNRLSQGKEIQIPNLGMETLHHVHADDVAQAFEKCVENRQKAIGHSFHVVSEHPLSLKEYAQSMAEWFGQTAKLSFLPWKIWKKTVSKRDADLTWDHILHSPNGSIDKAKKLLKYQPKYSSLQAVQEAIAYYFGMDKV
jgi:nucleoside-diphosphate-sugar epimerase